MRGPPAPRRSHSSLKHQDSSSRIRAPIALFCAIVAAVACTWTDCLCWMLDTTRSQLASLVAVTRCVSKWMIRALSTRCLSIRSGRHSKRTTSWRWTVRQETHLAPSFEQKATRLLSGRIAGLQTTFVALSTSTTAPLVDGPTHRRYPTR